MKTRVHAIAGGIGFLMILLFWTSTAVSELFARHETIAAVKTFILKGMFILIPAMVIAGGSGMVLELLAGAANLTMMGLNIRDGLTMTGKIGGTGAMSSRSQ